MDGQWLKTQFEVNPAKSKIGLAEAIGLTPSAISKILNGGRQIKAQEYMLMREFFGLPVDGQTSLHKKSDHDGVHTDGLNDDPAGSSEWMLPVRILSSGTAVPGEKTRIFQVQEDVMEPDFRRGDHVLVDVTDRKPLPPGIFVVSDGFGNMLRHCEFIAKANSAEIRISARGRFQMQQLKLEDFLIVGRVIAKLQMV